MAEAAATALGVIGFLGQLFDGCVRAYGYFTTAARLDQDSARLVCKLRDRYGIVEEAAAKSGLARGEREARERDGGKERGWRKELTLRAKWVIADKEKFTALLRDLKDFNDGLDQLFPPSRLPSLHRAWRHSLLDHAQRDVAELALLASSAEDSSSNDSSSTNCPRQPYRKSHDIYSLGLVLLEIGWWKVLSTYYKPHYSAERWRDKVVLPVLVPGLASKTGRLYRDVVERCLTVHEDMSSSEAGEVMEWVVATLESIRT
ncbi:hypothetical protein VdG1_03014 [Verticillium dahliae VDG1]|nr:hypothetical protein VdG1_03014 [Verticillium dahliae VDG1]